MPQQRDAGVASQRVGGAELQARQAFLERVEADRSTRAQDVQRSEAEVADRGEKLVVAATEHEMLNRLRERRRSEHELEAARDENKLLDEMAGARTAQERRMSTRRSEPPAKCGPPASSKPRPASVRSKT